MQVMLDKASERMKRALWDKANAVLSAPAGLEFLLTQALLEGKEGELEYEGVVCVCVEGGGVKKAVIFCSVQREEVCLSVSLDVCLSVSVRLPICVSVSLPACLSS